MATPDRTGRHHRLGTGQTVQSHSPIPSRGTHMLSFEKVHTATSKSLEQTPNPTDKDIRALALDLAIQEYEAAIRSRLASRDMKLAQAQLFAEHSYFVFVEPGQKPITIAEGATEVVMEQPARQSYKVRDKDLAAFAKEFGLDVDA